MLIQISIDDKIAILISGLAALTFIMTILFSAIPKDILIYLDQMNIDLFKHVVIRT